MRRLGIDWRDCYFWATHQGAEIHIGKATYPLTRQIRAVAFERIGVDIAPLR